MRPIAIVKMGETLPEIAARRGDFEHWIGAGLELPPSELCVVEAHRGAPLPAPSRFSAIVLTGSPALVTDREDWSERTAAWLTHAVTSRRPLLAICYGHQLLAHALGGRAGDNPRGREIGTIEVVRRDDAGPDRLMDALPPRLLVQASHIQSVREPPPGAVLLAHNGADPHHAYRLGDRVWGVQFHPEFDADIVRGYITGRRDQLLTEGLDPDALVRSSADSPHGGALLRRFAQIARQIEEAGNDAEEGPKT